PVPGWWRWQAQGHQQLRWLQRRMPRAQAKLFQRHETLTLRTSDAALRAIGEQGWQRIAGWRGVADIPPDCRQIANLHARKRRRCLGQGRVMLLDRKST